MEALWETRGGLRQFFPKYYVDSAFSQSIHQPLLKNHRLPQFIIFFSEVST